jgi:hypothetical protein
MQAVMTKVNPGVTVQPINHVCMGAFTINGRAIPCNEKAVPERTMRAGATHYHYCGRCPRK